MQQCANCFEGITVTKCQQCGYENSVGNGPLALTQGQILADQYLIGRILGKAGGFGITYLGWDIRLHKKVAIKEFLPRDYAGRDNNNQTVACYSIEDQESFKIGLEQFLQEARTLAKFAHANIVGVKSFFEENNTAYLVMDYYEGLSLQEYVTERGGHISEQETIDIIMPILDGLRDVHSQGILHRDIKPQNIYLTANGRPILLDFGAARQALGNRSKNLSVLLTGGFSPYEQYHAKGKQGQWTDIYACAATMYYLVTGQVPQDALERITDDELIAPRQIVPQLSVKFETAVLNGLAVNPLQRPQTVEQFQQYLQGVSVAPVNSPVQQVVPPYVAPPSNSGYPPNHAVPVKNSNNSVILAVGGTLLVVAILFGGWTFFNKTGDLNSQAPSPAIKTQPVVKSEQGVAPALPQTTTSQSRDNSIAKMEVEKTVNDFYDSISQRQYRNAYDCFSNKWKSEVTYDGWIGGYKDTLSNQVLRLNVLGDLAANATSATVQFSLKSRDRERGRILVQTFEGEWQLIKEGNRWVLNDARIKKVDSYYE